MIIIGTKITNTKIKVDGSFIDGSQENTISATSPPNPPENKVGKDAVLYLNPATGELFWDYVDRPLTDAERETQLETDMATANYALMMGGLLDVN